MDIQTRKEILLCGWVSAIKIITLSFVWNTYFSVWTMDHVLFDVCLTFIRGVSTGTLLVVINKWVTGVEGNKYDREQQTWIRQKTPQNRVAECFLCALFISFFFLFFCFCFFYTYFSARNTQEQNHKIWLKRIKDVAYAKIRIVHWKAYPNLWALKLDLSGRIL